MANSYKWSSITPSGLTSMSVDGQTLQQVYTSISFRMAATDGANNAETAGTVALGAPSPSSFTPAQDVTQDQLVGWLTDALGADQISGIKAWLDERLAALEVPTFTGIPLSNIAC